jgi:hypothetical protein
MVGLDPTTPCETTTLEERSNDDGMVGSSPTMTPCCYRSIVPVRLIFFCSISTP